jgi:hypothetical protein
LQIIFFLTQSHLQAVYHDDRGKYAHVQKSQLIEMKQFIEKKRKEHPEIDMVVCGDFNVNGRMDKESKNGELFYDEMVKLFHPEDSLIEFQNLHHEFPVTYGDSHEVEEEVIQELMKDEMKLEEFKQNVSKEGEETKEVENKTMEQEVESISKEEVKEVEQVKKDEEIEEVKEETKEVKEVKQPETNVEENQEEFIAPPTPSTPMSPNSVNRKVKKPKETVLTHPMEQMSELTLDYMFFGSISKKISVESSKVEPFYVEGKVYTQLSDHYGLSATFKITNENKTL